MGFLGIDQSLNATGLCTISEAGDVVTAKTIDPEGRVGGERLVYIKRAVESVLDGIGFAAIEGYAYGSVGRVFELGEIGGVLKTLLTERQVKYVIVPPILVKKFATGSTSAAKEEMVLAARESGDKSFYLSDDNQADAYFLAKIARAYVRGADRRRCEMEVIHSLKSPLPKTKSRGRARRLIKSAV